MDVTALPLDDELAGEVLPHEQKGGDDEPAEEQHETRHQQPMEEDAEGDKGEAKGVDTKDFKGTGKPRLPKIVTALTRRWYGWRDFPAIPSIAGGFFAHGTLDDLSAGLLAGMYCWISDCGFSCSERIGCESLSIGARVA